jgi:hypothetical protein
MKQTLIIGVLFFLISCKSNFPLEGNYEKVGSDFSYTLHLNKDSTFVLTQKYFEVNASCNGKWKITESNEIMLECKEATLFEQLQSGYISNRIMSLKIIKPKKLKLNNVIMHKIETQ